MLLVFPSTSHRASVSSPTYSVKPNNLSRLLAVRRKKKLTDPTDVTGYTSLKSDNSKLFFQKLNVSDRIILCYKYYLHWHFKLKHLHVYSNLKKNDIQVNLKAGEGAYTEAMSVIKPAVAGFTLRPSQGSAFQPLQPAPHHYPHTHWLAQLSPTASMFRLHAPNCPVLTKEKYETRRISTTVQKILL